MLLTLILNSMLHSQSDRFEKKREAPVLAIQKKWCAQAPKGMKEATEKLYRHDRDLNKLILAGTRDPDAEFSSASLPRFTTSEMAQLKRLSEEATQALTKVVSLSRTDAANDSIWRTKNICKSKSQPIVFQYRGKPTQLCQTQIECMVPYGPNCTHLIPRSVEEVCITINGQCPSAENGDLARACLLDKSTERAAYLKSLEERPAGSANPNPRVQK